MQQLTTLAELLVNHSEPVSGEDAVLQAALSRRFSKLKPTWRARLVDTDSGFRQIQVEDLSSRVSAPDHEGVSRNLRRAQSYRDAFDAGERSDGLDDSQQDGLHPLADDSRPTDEG
jgi:hypothetical protein